MHCQYEVSVRSLEGYFCVGFTEFTRVACHFTPKSTPVWKVEFALGMVVQQQISSQGERLKSGSIARRLRFFKVRYKLHYDLRKYCSRPRTNVNDLITGLIVDDVGYLKCNFLIVEIISSSIFHLSLVCSKPIFVYPKLSLQLSHLTNYTHKSWRKWNVGLQYSWPVSISRFPSDHFFS